MSYRRSTWLLLIVFLCAWGVGSAHPALVYVIGPPTSTTSTFPGDHATAVSNAVKTIVTKLDTCTGVSAMLLDRTKGLPDDFGSESAEAYVAAADATPAPKITLTLQRGTSREVLAVKTFDATAAGGLDYCALIGPSVIIGAQPIAQPLRTPRYFEVIPQDESDRQYFDLLLFRLREFGYSGELLPADADRRAELDNLCVTNRRALEYHVDDPTYEQKNQGSNTITTSASATVFSCNGSQSLDTMFAAPRTEVHYVGFGTLVSSLVGLAVALKPKISTPQLTSALPLFSSFINRPDSLAQKQNDTISEAFRVMLCRFTNPNNQYTSTLDKGLRPETYEPGSGHPCGKDRTSRSQTGLRI